MLPAPIIPCRLMDTRKHIADSFIRKITFQEILPEGIKTIGPAIEEMAANEHLDAHKNAVTIRLKAINK